MAVGKISGLTIIIGVKGGVVRFGGYGDVGRSWNLMRNVSGGGWRRYGMKFGNTIRIGGGLESRSRRGCEVLAVGWCKGSIRFEGIGWSVGL